MSKPLGDTKTWSEGYKAGRQAKKIIGDSLHTVSRRVNEVTRISLKKRARAILEILPAKAAWISGFGCGAGLSWEDSLLVCLETAGLTPIPGCTAAFASGTAAEGQGSIVMKNGDIDSHWYMQMTCSEPGISVEGDFYSGELARYASAGTRYGFVGQRCFSYWAPHMGINQAGLSVSLLAAPGREDEAEKGLLGGFDYNRIVLENAGSAEEAVEILGNALGRFGFSDVSMMYVLADRREVWVLEASGFQWAARRYRDTVGARANDFRIEREYDAASSDLVSHALEMGWITDKREFNFRDVYSGKGYLHHVQAPYPDIFSSTVRYERAYELVRSRLREGSVDIEHMLSISRDQLDRYRLPAGGSLDFNQKPWYSTGFFRDDYSGGEWLDEPAAENTQKAPAYIRQICCDTIYEKTLGAAVFISPARPGDVKGAMLSCVGVPTFSVFCPFFPVGDSIDGRYLGVEAAGLFEDIDLHAFGKYEEFHPVAEEVFHPMEIKHITGVRSTLSSGTPEQARSLSLQSSGEACRAAEVVIARFWLRDARIRSWGRGREYAGKVPYAYLTRFSKDVLTRDGVVSGATPGLRTVAETVEIRSDILKKAAAHTGAVNSISDGKEYLEPGIYAEKAGLVWRYFPENGEAYLFIEDKTVPL